LRNTQRGFTTAVVIVISLAAACGSSGQGTPARTADTNATVVLRATSDINSYDPALNTATYGVTFLGAVYDSLVKPKPDGTYGAQLATDWAFVDNSSALQMHVRKDVMFSDGTPFNATAVKANLERDKTLKGSTAASELGSVAGVDAVDDTTVKIRLNPGTGATLLDSLSNKPGYMVSPAAFTKPDLGKNPVGTGPFRLATWKVGASVTFDRNPTYWGNKPQVAHIQINILGDDQAAVNALKTGELDAMVGNYSVASPLLDDLMATKGVRVKQIPTTAVQNINLNPTRPGLNDQRVRQAISFAIDRVALAKAIGRGAPGDEYAHPDSVFFNPHVTDYYAYNPPKAKQLLADAGYATGLSIEFVVNSAIAVNSDMAQILQQELGAVGIKVAIRAIDGATILQSCFVQSKCDAVIGENASRLDPENEATLLFAPTAVTNYAKATPPDMAPLMKLAEEPTSQAEHIKRVQDVLAQMVVNAINLVVWYRNHYSETRDKVEVPWLGIQSADYAAIVKYK
jgi:peptide/nickel transport system substrate-binding protein